MGWISGTGLSVRTSVLYEHGQSLMSPWLEALSDQRAKVTSSVDVSFLFPRHPSACSMRSCITWPKWPEGAPQPGCALTSTCMAFPSGNCSTGQRQGLIWSLNCHPGFSAWGTIWPPGGSFRTCTPSIRKGRPFVVTALGSLSGSTCLSCLPCSASTHTCAHKTPIRHHGISTTGMGENSLVLFYNR